jgi:hypothetical protein
LLLFFARLRAGDCLLALCGKPVLCAFLGGFAAAFACLGAFFRLGNVLILRGRCSSSRLSAGNATGLAPEESESFAI